MDFRNALLKIGREFQSAREEEFGGHALAGFIRSAVPSILEGELRIPLDEMLIEASPGQGRWNLSPWIRIADTTVSDSAMRGYYPVYLFTVDMQAVVLTLARGYFGSGFRKV
jgi:5-methylcytosine-specific restriction protein A